MKFTPGQKLPKNESYDYECRNFEYLENAVIGGSIWVNSFKPNGKRVVTQFPDEELADYKFRKETTRVKNYLPYIIDKYVSAVFRNKPKRDSDEWYMDVTGRGTEADVFWMMVLRNAMTYGYTFVLPDTYEDYPIIRHIKPQFVPFYEETETGETIAALVVEGDAGFYMDSTTLTKLVVKDGKVMSVVSEEPNPYGKCPLVKVWPELASNAFLDPIVEALVSYTNHKSLLAQEIYEKTYTSHYVSGTEKPQQDDDEPNFTFGSKRILFFRDPAVTVGSIGSDVSQADSIRKELEEDRESIFQLAGLKEDKSTANESGLSKLIGLESFAIMTRIFSASIEEAEIRVMELIDSVLGTEHAPVKYERSVLEKSSEEALLELRDLLSLQLPIVLKKKKIAEYAEKYFGLTSEEKEELERELLTYGSNGDGIA